MKIALVAAILASLTPSALAGQERLPTPNPGSACFEVVVSRGEAVEYEGGIEFILAPSASPAPNDLQVWDLRGPIRSANAALWWPQGTDSIAAVWLREEGILWELHLDPVPEVMLGTASQIVPKPDQPLLHDVRATQVECPRQGE